MTYRGYTENDVIHNEADRAVLGVLRWSLSPGGAGVFKYIKASVRWA